MESISNIRIEGIDENRPPTNQNALYIDLFFKLNQEAPGHWCSDFNNLMSKHPSKSKIDIDEGKYIQTWVKSADDIAAHLEELKEAVTTCTAEHFEKVERSRHSANAGINKNVDDDSPQGRLNKIVAELNFDVEEVVTKTASG